MERKLQHRDNAADVDTLSVGFGMTRLSLP